MHLGNEASGGFHPASLERSTRNRHSFVRDKVLCNESLPESESESHSQACGPGGGGGAGGVLCTVGGEGDPPVWVEAPGVGDIF